VHAHVYRAVATNPQLHQAAVLCALQLDQPLNATYSAGVVASCVCLSESATAVHERTTHVELHTEQVAGQLNEASAAGQLAA
jgi:hypothetical protein